jgi:hypothetical protein
MSSDQKLYFERMATMTFFLNVELMILGVLQPFWCSLSCGILVIARSRTLKYAGYKSGRGTQRGFCQGSATQSTSGNRIHK